MIYTNLNNSGEVEAVYAAKRVTITGTPPLSYPSKGYDLEDFLISGNTVQNGTPTPSDPVDVQGVGKKTENLFDYVAYFSSTLGYNAYFDYAEVQLTPNTTYTFSTNFIDGVAGTTKETPFVVMNGGARPQTAVGGLGNKITRTLITDSSGVVRVYKRINSNSQAETPTLQDFQNGKWVMCNLGSEPIPYEPYGYKLPLTIGDTEYPIYLGQVPTTRRIKKLVLTGEEGWNAYTSIADCYRLDIRDNPGIIGNGICSHYAKVETTSQLTDGTFVSGQNYSYFKDVSAQNLDGWKSYLAAQYASGTPVTVWYVLAESETAVVNEPLHKIGDYADTISLSQSGITVSTTAGTNTITTETTVLPSSISVTTPEKEVEEIYAGINYQNPIYYKSRTLTGTLPLSYKALSKPLSDYLISGNTAQDGTPSPKAPVDVVGCGVRTGNLFDLSTATNEFINSNGKITPASGEDPYYLSDYISADNVTISVQYKETAATEIFSVGIYDSSKNFIQRDVVSNNNVSYENVAYIRINYRGKNCQNVMCNTGSTPFPYEPYGYKLPLTVNGTEYPIYLGECESTRRIKKLVLTGEEAWTISTAWKSTNTSVFYTTVRGANNQNNNVRYVVSDRFISASRNEVNSGDTDMIGLSSRNALTVRISDNIATTLTEFKTYLSAQYTNGTPVIVWYVLATGTTGIVNETLMKIGDYADTITMTQAGVTISTVSSANVLDMASTVKPSAVSITGNIKPIT